MSEPTSAVFDFLPIIEFGKIFQIYFPNDLLEAHSKGE